MQTAVNQRNYRQHQVTLNWVLRRLKKYLEVDSLSDWFSRCFELGFILIKQLLWKGAIENKSSEWVLCELRGSAAVTRRKKTCNLLQRKVLCFSGHCQGSKSKSRIIYNTRHICWKTTVMLRPLPPPAPNVDSRITYLEWAISDFPGPQYQNEVKCSAFDMEMILYSHANKTHFHKKDCALGLILKVRVFGTRKWSIKLESQHWRRREEVLSGKRSISWLSRHDMKNPQFQSTVSTKLDEYCRSFQHLYSRSLHWWRDNLAFLANFNLLMCQKGLNEHRKLKKRKNR